MSKFYPFKSRQMAAAFAAGYAADSVNPVPLSVSRIILPDGEKPWAVIADDGSDTETHVADILSANKLPALEN